MNDVPVGAGGNRGASMVADLARSREPLGQADLSRLGRVADAELEAFCARNPRLVGWRDRVRIIALAQGGAEHYLIGAPSRLGRCPYDPPEYTGRAVDVAFWVIPDRPDAVVALREWLGARAAKHPNPERKPDLAHESVVLIRPDLGSVAWDPPNVPLARAKAHGHRPPQGLALP
jgi:hypothetical protein